MEHVHGAQITDLANQLRITREREVRVKDENEQLKRTVVEIRADSSKNTKETESLSQRVQALQQESFALKNENKMLHSEVSGLQQKNHELALTHQTGAHLMGSPHSGSSEDKCMKIIVLHLIIYVIRYHPGISQRDLFYDGAFPSLN